MSHTKLAEKLNKNVAPVRGRNPFTREAYINVLPDDKEVHVDMDAQVVAYKFISRRGNPSLMAFAGRANKPAIHKAYHTMEDLDRSLSNYIANVKSSKQYTQKRKDSRNVESSLKVGDILYTSWGYEQTNVEFFQVVKTIGKRTVEIKRINKIRTDRSTPPTDYVVPVPDSFIEDGYQSKENGRYRVAYGNQISMNSYKSAWLWDGTPKYETSLGYGH